MRTLIHITTMMITLGMVACSAGPTGDDTAEENLPVVANPVAEAIQDSKDSGLTVRELCVYNDQLIWLTWDEETILIYKDEEQVSAPIRFEILAHWGYEFQVTEQGIFQIREIAYGGHDSIIFADPFGETLVFKGFFVRRAFFSSRVSRMSRRRANIRKEICSMTMSGLVIPPVQNSVQSLPT